jgi:RNA polymerase sigma-70 factor (ECF subfamily)
LTIAPEDKRGEPVTTLDGTVDLAGDRELVQRCQTGDESSFAELYNRYHRRLLRFCLRRLHSHDDAEEAVQEAFARAWRALPRFGGERRFYPWLTVIAANICTDMLRRRARVVPMQEMPRQAVEIDGEDDVDAELLRQVDLAMATEALTHLSDRHQRVLRLRETTEWSAQRIAESEGVAVPAVDTLLWRARQAFKREFALLSDAGGLAGLVGLGLAALRRSVARSWLRIGSQLPAPLQGPRALAAAAALTGAAIAGGSVALVGAGSAPHASPPSGPAQVSSATGTSRPRGRTESGRTGTAAAMGREGGTSKHPRRDRTGASGLGGVLDGRGARGVPASRAAGAGFSQLFSVAGDLAKPITGSTTSSSSTPGNPVTTLSGTVRTATTMLRGTARTATTTLSGTTGTMSSTSSPPTTSVTPLRSNGTSASSLGSPTGTTSTAASTTGSAGSVLDGL